MIHVDRVEIDTSLEVDRVAPHVVKEGPSMCQLHDQAKDAFVVPVPGKQAQDVRVLRSRLVPRLLLECLHTSHRTRCQHSADLAAPCNQCLLHEADCALQKLGLEEATLPAD